MYVPAELAYGHRGAHDNHAHVKSDSALVVMLHLMKIKGARRGVKYRPYKDGPYIPYKAGYHGPEEWPQESLHRWEDRDL